MTGAWVRPWFWVAVAALSIAAWGCGGDDDSGASGPDPFANAPKGNPSHSGSGTAGDGSGAAGDGSGVSAAPGSSNCPEGLARTSSVTPRVIMVLDGSCSMSTNYPANGQPSSTRCEQNPNSRWSALRNALLDPQRGVVTQLQGSVEFGMVVFGTQPSCPLTGDPVAPALNNLNAIDRGFPQQAPPGMYTPTGQALDWVYDNLITPPAPDGRMDPQIVVLATDGEPNSCNQAVTDYQSPLNAVTKGSGLGARTYVISLADSAGEFHDHLQQLADVGVNGSGKLYTPGTPQELEADLTGLIGGAVGCELALNGRVQPGMECSATVTLDGESLSCNDPNGYVLIDANHIKLQGLACDTLMNQPSAVLSARFPCGVFMVD